MFFRPTKIISHLPKITQPFRTFSSSNNHKPIKYFSKIPSHSSILLQVVENYNMRNKHISESLLEHEFKNTNFTAIRFYMFCMKNAATMEKFLKVHDVHKEFITNEKGHFEIHAKHSLYFLASLASTKKELASDFVIGKNAFEEFISQLEKNKFLSQNEAHHYLKEINTDLTIKEMEALAYKTNDFTKALELAHLHKNHLQSTLYWVEKAFEFNPELKIDAIQNILCIHEVEKISKMILPSRFRKKIEALIIENEKKVQEIPLENQGICLFK